jgi:hypothetical protein
VKHSNQEGAVPGYGKVYCDKDAIVANIFGFSDLKTKHQITYNSEKEDASIVHKKSGNIKFECSPEGLYQYEVILDYKENIKENEHATSNLVITVNGNQKGYILHQYERAKEMK